ncbi:hypothetical protein PSCICJ_04270 [Pseudomonas cichorii]|nr:hypothetical protein PSCICJ_04270 [Pseudomonas cichorii]
MLRSTVRILARQNHRLLDPGTLRQACFDFTDFNPEATNLDLLVITAPILYRAIRQPAGQVACTVQTGCRVGAERISHKHLLSQFRTIEITQCDAITTDIQLAGYAQWHWLLASIEYVQTGIGQRLANGNAALAYGLDFMGRREGRGFGRAIAVQQVLGRAVFQNLSDNQRIQHVAADNQVTQLSKGVVQA